MALPPYDAEVMGCGIVSSLGDMCMDGKGFLQVLLEPFPQSPGCFPYILFIAYKLLTLVHVNCCTLLVYFPGNEFYPILAANLLNTLS